MEEIETGSELLKVEEIGKKFDGTRALWDVSLSLSREMVVGLIGANGAGKSTFANVVTGFSRPEVGRIIFEGKEITGLSPSSRSVLGISRTFQMVRLIGGMTVLDNVILAVREQIEEDLVRALTRIGVGRDKRRAQDAAKRALDRMEIGSLRNRLARELSYGQRKLVSIASCIAANSKMLILDEPVAGLQPRLVRKVLDTLVELKEESRLVIFIEHDLEAVKEVCDKVIVLERGRILVEGTPSNVFAGSGVLETFIE